RTAASGRAATAGGGPGEIVVVSTGSCAVRAGCRCSLVDVEGTPCVPSTIPLTWDGLGRRDRLREDRLAVGPDLVQAVGLQGRVAVLVEPVGCVAPPTR